MKIFNYMLVFINEHRLVHVCTSHLENFHTFMLTYAYVYMSFVIYVICLSPIRKQTKTLFAA